MNLAIKSPLTLDATSVSISEMSLRDHLVAKRLTPDTIRNYELRIRQSEEWCSGAGVDLLAATPTEIVALAATFKRTSTVLGQLRSALNYYYEYHERAKPPSEAIIVPTQPPMQPRSLSAERVRLLDKTARYWLPEGFAVLVGLYLGLRVSEIASMEWDRFDRDRKWYSCLGKHSRTRHIPVHPVVADDLRYIRQTSEYLFPGSAGRAHVSKSTVWKWCIKVAEEAGIGRITTHELRHTAITQLYERTGDVFVAQAFAGHSRTDTTRGYVRFNAERLVAGVHLMDYQSDE